MSILTKPITTVAAGVFVLAAACSSGGSSKANPTTTTTSSTSVAPATTSSTSASTVAPPTTLPANRVASAVWPTAASGTRFTDPVAAARGFAVDLVHMVNPVMGAFRQGDSRSGEVPVRAKATGGPVTTVLVRQLGTDGSWSVIGSSTPAIQLAQPVVGATVASPLTLRGRSTAFEATVNVAIRQDDVKAPLADTFFMGGSNGQMGPFDTSVKFSHPTSRYGAIVLYTISSEDGHVAEATVIRVRFAGA